VVTMQGTLRGTFWPLLEFQGLTAGELLCGTTKAKTERELSSKSKPQREYPARCGVITTSEPPFN